MTPHEVAQGVGPYFLTDLGGLSTGNRYSTAEDINAAGQVVGTFATATGAHSYLWQPDGPNRRTGTLVALDDLPGGRDESHAFAINNRGQIVGRGNAVTGQRAYLWQPDVPNGSTGSVFNLGDLPGGDDWSDASGINLHGQIVGYSQTGANWHAFLWQPTTANGTVGDLIDLGDLPGGDDSSIGSDINDQGQIVGTSRTTDFDGRPFLWQPLVPNGTTGALYNLGVVPGGLGDGLAIGINNRGHIVGASLATAGHRAFVSSWENPFPGDGHLVDLGDLPAANDYSFANDVNERGDIVGVGTSNGSRAVLWNESGELFDLNNFLDDASGDGWTLEVAEGINDVGQIVGHGLLNGQRRAFLLTPLAIPEPSAAYLGVGLAVPLLAGAKRGTGVFLYRERRKGRDSN
jgi:probable HAF family extracellular repeat protein